MNTENKDSESNSKVDCSAGYRYREKVLATDDKTFTGQLITIIIKFLTFILHMGRAVS